MKLLEFPKTERDEDVDIKAETLSFMDEAKSHAEELQATHAVVILMDEEGNIALSACGSYLDVNAMLAVALKSF